VKGWLNMNRLVLTDALAGEVFLWGKPYGGYLKGLIQGFANRQVLEGGDLVGAGVRGESIKSNS